MHTRRDTIPRPAPWRERCRGQEGFTLIEIMATALIVALIASALAVGLIGNAHLSGVERSQAQGNTLAEQDQERLRGMTGNELAGLNQTQTVTLDGNTYTVHSTAALLSSAGSASCATSGTGAVAYYSVTSTVSWHGLNGATPSVTEHSDIAPPAGGTLQAAINDQTGTPLSGVGVTATGPSTDGGTTDVTGCVEITGLPTGSYALAIARTGYVDPNGNATITDSTSVTSSGTAFPSVNPHVLGQAGSIAFTFTAPPAAGSQQAAAVSYYGQGSASSMTAYKPVSLSSPYTGTTLLNLFPFAFTVPSVSYTNNYSVWAGGCSQNEPPSPSTFSVWPGGTLTGQSVPEPALAVFVKNSLGIQVVPSQVELKFSSTSGTACSSADSYPTVASTSSPTLGVLQYPGQPYANPASTTGQAGGYTVCAAYGGHYQTASGVANSAMGSANPVTLTVTSSSPSGSTCPAL